MFIDCSMFILTCACFCWNPLTLFYWSLSHNMEQEPVLQYLLKGKLRQTLQISLICDYLPWKYPSYTSCKQVVCVLSAMDVHYTVVSVSKLDILNSIAILWYKKFYHFVSFCNFLIFIYWQELLKCCSTCNRIRIVPAIKDSQKEKKPVSLCHIWMFISPLAMYFYLLPLKGRD